MCKLYSMDIYLVIFWLKTTNYNLTLLVREERSENTKRLLILYKSIFWELYDVTENKIKKSKNGEN